MSSASPIWVEFAGVEYTVHDRLTFGRAGELELDTNPQLHRLAGEFVRSANRWTIKNLGSRLFLNCVDATGSRHELAPGAEHVISAPTGTVGIAVGPARYEITWRVEAIPGAAGGVPSGGAATASFEVNLTPREVDVLVTFARPVLLGLRQPLPTYAEVAALWGIAPKTLDNTVQTIKRKMKGARLLREDPLDVMVKVAVAHSLVTRDDLAWASLGNDNRLAVDGPRFATP